MAHPEWSDAEMLEALEMRRRGLSATVIGARLGRSRSAVCGLFHRIDRETDATDQGGLGNRSLPADWWRAGLIVDSGRRSESRWGRKVIIWLHRDNVLGTQGDLFGGQG